MAGLQTLYYDKRKDDDPRGRRRVKGWRVTINTPGSPIVNIFLSVKKYRKNDAEQCRIIAATIEEAYKKRLPLDERTTRRLDEYPDFKKDLAEKGLIDLSDEKTLFEFWEEYENANVNNWAPGTYQNKRQRAKFLLEYFNPKTPVNALTKKDAQGFRNYLDDLIESGTFSDATANNYVKDLKAAFNWGLKNDLVKNNPFQFISIGAMRNPARQYYLTPADFQKLLDACPSQEWRVFLLLQRVQGCRLGETQLIQWADVDFNNGLLLIHSPKTRRHKGKDKRTAPLFPDVAEALERLKEERQTTGEESPFVLTTVRGGNANLRNVFLRIIERAGLKKWERIFQNLRASASTDIYNDFGDYYEAQWVGHGHDVAIKHYLQITPAKLAAAKNWSPLAAAKERDALANLPR